MREMEEKMDRVIRKGERSEKEKKLVRHIIQEYQLFRYQMLEKKSYEIFDSCNKIQFYCCIKEYFQLTEFIEKDVVDVLKDEVCPIELLWNYYLRTEYLQVALWENIKELLRAYVSDCKRNRFRGVE